MLYENFAEICFALVKSSPFSKMRSKFDSSLRKSRKKETSQRTARRRWNSMHFPKLLFYLLSRNKTGWVSKDSKWFPFRKLSASYRTYQSGRLLLIVTISLSHVFAFASIFDGWVFMGVFMIITSCAEIICQN